MKNMVGRKDEIKKINRFFNSPKAEFLAVYGRRRIGKTYLIQNFFSKSNCIFFHVTGLKDGSLRDQILNFTRVIGNTFYQGAEIRLKDNWLEVFEQLSDAISKIPSKMKVVLFFDELPWMATKRSKLIQAIDHFWNRYWSIDPRIKLIVCGSSASWILEKLIQNKGGLHNRITYQILLQPLSLIECRQFLLQKRIKLDHAQILKIYMIMGGVPFYLDQIEKGLSADQNIDEICFTKQGLLFTEFERLFASLFDEHETNEELIRLISKSRYGISQTQLMKKSSKSVGGRLKKRLKELVDTGFIEMFVPYQHKERGIYYKVIDEYTFFYLNWIEPIKNSIKRKDREEGYWLSKYKTPAWNSWAGYTFESVCYKHIAEIRKQLRINPGSEVGTWRYIPKNQNEETGVQIDLLFDREDGVITICEIKYTSMPYTIDKEYEKKLVNKVKVYKEKTRSHKQMFIAMITTNGIKQNKYSNDLISQVMTLDDFFTS